VVVLIDRLQVYRILCRPEPTRSINWQENPVTVRSDYTNEIAVESEAVRIVPADAGHAISPSATDEQARSET
jgi:hypothetical protein